MQEIRRDMAVMDNKNYNNTIGGIIRSLRKRANMTQEDLADGICSAVSVSRIENGAQMPSSTVLEALLDKLGTSTYHICNIFYQTDEQLAFDRQADYVANCFSAGRISEATELLRALEEYVNKDPLNMQYYLLLTATANLYDSGDNEETLSLLRKALAITKPSLDLTAFRDVLLTIREANILNLIAVSLFKSGQSHMAIRMSNELFQSLSRHNSTVSGYNILRINVAINLAQYLENEGKYSEAIMYCNQAEILSKNSQEQALLPEIQFIKAMVLHSMGKDSDSSAILMAVVPYMELIGKKEFAKLAIDFAKKELNLQI